MISCLQLWSSEAQGKTAVKLASLSLGHWTECTLTTKPEVPSHIILLLLLSLIIIACTFVSHAIVLLLRWSCLKPSLSSQDLMSKHTALSLYIYGIAIKCHLPLNYCRSCFILGFSCLSPLLWILLMVGPLPVGCHVRSQFFSHAKNVGNCSRR